MPRVTLDLTGGLMSDNLSWFCVMDVERGLPPGWMLPRRGSPLRRPLSHCWGDHPGVRLCLVDEGELEQEEASACSWVCCVQRGLNTDGISSRGGHCFFLSFHNLLEKTK